MSEHKKKKDFIKLPRYLGDRESFRDFVAKHLVYPAEAIENQVEGVVHLSYRVDDKGRIHDLRVDHGIGYGCDEEAIRLVMLMKYAPVKNRGVRVTSRQRTRIEFKLPQAAGPAYTVAQNKKDEDQGKKATTYTYTLKITNKKD